MKGLVQYISENQASIEEYRETMGEIDLDIVLESFSCKILQDISSQIKAIQKKRKAELDEINSKQWEKEWMKPSVPAPPHDFKKIFVYNSIRWDTIKDDQVKEWEKDDKDGMKIVKRICSNRSNSIPGLVVLPVMNPESPETKYAGVIIKDNWNISYHSLLGGWCRGEGSMKPKEAEAAVTTKFWTIELRNDQLSNSVRNERSSAKYGSIKMGDPDEYKKIAEENRERYRKLAEKKRVEKSADDGIVEKVMDYVQKVMDVSEAFSKDPVKYAKYEYSIQGLLALIGDRKRYDSRNGHSYGTDGMMYVFNTYLTKKLSIAKGTSYSHEKEDFERSKKALAEIFKKIDTKIAEMNL